MIRNILSTKAVTLLLAGILFLIFICGCTNSNNSQSGNKTSVYDQVIKSGTIRCGYVIYPPCVVKDPNTGKLSGIFVEVLEKAADNLKLKVDWKEEVGWGTMIEGLEAGRYDIVPTGIWPNATRGRQADFTIPLYYSAIGVYVRSKDNRFNSNNLSKINSSDIKISTIDGQVPDVIAREQFPLAKRVSHPEMANASDPLLDVTQGKADLTFIEPGIAADFLKSNPGTLKNITVQKPVEIFGNTMMIKRGEYEYKNMLNVAIEELINNGYVDRICNKYEPAPGVYYRIAPPYNTPENK